MNCCFGSSAAAAAPSEAPAAMKEENRWKGKGKAGGDVLAPPPSQRISKINAEREEKVEGTELLPQREIFTTSENMNGLDSKQEESSAGGRMSSFESKLFTYEQLAFATQNFKQDCLLGEGGFGSVYRGFLDSLGKVVAVKKLNQSGIQGNREFLTEVLMLTLLDHPNLVKLIGYCAEGDQRLLVYEFMPLGSLEDHLHDIAPHKKPLDWNTRMKIALGAAKGLDYLHNVATPPVIYRDMKSSNILLDEGYFPKLSDFGLAKLGPVGDNTHVSTRVMGTYGYCAPEYAMTGQLTTKSDIFSFGVLLLEIITGRRAIDYTKKGVEQNLVAWARPLFRDRKNFTKMADPLLEGHYPPRGLYQALAVAAMCVMEQATQRPVIADIVSALDYLASQTYVPSSSASPSHRISRAQTKTEQMKNLNIGSDGRSNGQSPSHRSPDLSSTNGTRSRAGDGLRRKQELDGSLITDKPQEDGYINARKMKESRRNVNQDSG